MSKYKQQGCEFQFMFQVTKATATSGRCKCPPAKLCGAGCARYLLAKLSGMGCCVIGLPQ